jgi:hypothetical protein
VSWRPAKSLLTLRNQVDAKWPGRDKSSDGIIGDASHQATKSDHNPDGEGVVRAMDISNDPPQLVSRQLAETLLTSRDPRIRYIISNAQIVFGAEAAEANGATAWVWKAYHGENPHTAHMHLSVSHDDALADDTRPWAIDGAATPDHPPPPHTGEAWQSGKGSWYSQFVGKYRWVDEGDEPGSAALGVPDDYQGIALYDHSTLGHWFEVEAPNGVKSIEQQTDIGPNPRTGRAIDISAVAAERFGYTPRNFPTDGAFRWRPAPVPLGLEGLPPTDQAEQVYRLRDRMGPLPDPPPDRPPITPDPADVDPPDLAAIRRELAEQRAMLEKIMNQQLQPQPQFTQEFFDRLAASMRGNPPPAPPPQPGIIDLLKPFMSKTNLGIGGLVMTILGSLYTKTPLNSDFIMTLLTIFGGLGGIGVGDKLRKANDATKQVTATLDKVLANLPKQ